MQTQRDVTSGTGIKSHQKLFHALEREEVSEIVNFNIGCNGGKWSMGLRK